MDDIIETCDEIHVIDIFDPSFRTCYPIILKVMDLKTIPPIFRTLITKS